MSRTNKYDANTIQKCNTDETNMWRDKIIEAKKKNNITTKMMSELVHIPEPTITRILSGKTEFPRIDTVLMLGKAVGLSDMELFAETTSFLGDKNIVALQEELDIANGTVEALRTEIVTLSEENTDLKVKNVALTAENDMIRTKLEHKEEIISLHNYYKALIDGLKK